MKSNQKLFYGLPADYEGIKCVDNNVEFDCTEVKNIYLGKGLFYLCIQTNMLNNVIKFKPDVCILDINPRIISNIFVVLYCKLKSIKIIGWGLGILPWKKSNFFIDFIRNFLRNNYLKLFDAIITYSNKGRLDYINIVNIDSKKIFIACNSVDTSNAVKFVEKNKILKKNNGKISLVYVGRIIKEKNIELIFDAIKELDIDKKITINIIGDGPYLEELKSIANSYNYDIVFHGHKTGENLYRLIRQNDLFVLPGSGGLAIQEVMALGLPVLVGEGDGSQKDLVKDGVNGYLFKNRKEFKEKLKKLVSDRKLLVSMGKKSLDIIKNEWNMEKMAAGFLNAIEYVSKEKLQ